MRDGRRVLALRAARRAPRRRFLVEFCWTPTSVVVRAGTSANRLAAEKRNGFCSCHFETVALLNTNNVPPYPCLLPEDQHAVSPLVHLAPEQCVSCHHGMNKRQTAARDSIGVEFPGLMRRHCNNQTNVTRSGGTPKGAMHAFTFLDNLLAHMKTCDHVPKEV